MHVFLFYVFDLKLEEVFYPVSLKWSLRTAHTVTQMVGVPVKTAIMNTSEKNAVQLS